MNNTMSRKIISIILSLCFLFQQTGLVQAAAVELNLSGYFARMASSMDVDKFRPIHLRYFSYDSLNNSFKLLLDKGTDPKQTEAKLKEEAKELLKYFLIGVTLPNDKFWVNLRPDSPKQIIDFNLEETDIGKIMLEADLQLKKDTAAFTSPQSPEGKEYWNRLYKKAEEIYGTENITIPTLTRPWIIPNEIIVRETKDSAYIYKATLKVMLESDYLRDGSQNKAELSPKENHPYAFKDSRAKALNEYSSQLIRELIIPKLTKEVNLSKKYAPLRQVYYSLILSRWFKSRFYGKSGVYASLIDKNDLTNLTSKDSWSKSTYFNEYKKSFSDGEYNIKEPVYTPSGQTIRSYMSGGMDLTGKTMPQGIQNGFASSSLIPDRILATTLIPVTGNGLSLEFGNPETTQVAGSPAGSKGASSAVRTQEVTFNKLLRERFEARVNSLYGLTEDEARRLEPTLVKIGFDGKHNRLGWTRSNLEWIFNHPETVEAVIEDGKHIGGAYKYVIFCGMGGSGLSVQTVKTTFGERDVKIYSLRTTDPAVISDILDEIATQEGNLTDALSKTLVIPISKSGTTEETVSHKKYFETLFAKFGINPIKHMWVVTDKGSPMDTGDYIQREIQLNGKGDIGGRFTAPTTNIFLLPLALVAPEKVWEVLRAAREMNSGTNGDIFMQLAAFLYTYAKGERKDKITLLLPEELRDLAIWAEQLIEESLGKDGKGITLFYGENISPEDLRTADTNDRVFVHIKFKGQKVKSILPQYLKNNNYPIFEIEVDNPSSIGGLMLGFQRTVAAIAYLWDICFVDQPAVEGYKEGTREVMRGLKPGEKVTVPAQWRYSQFNTLKLYFGPILEIGAIGERELAAELGRLGTDINNAPAVYAAIINLLKNKPRFEAVELMSYGRMTSGLRKNMEEARLSIFTQGLQMASKLGEGPDKNHSFHQNIDDGRNMWLSTYFMPLQIKQPQALEYSENLIKAQTIGTIKSLIKNNRKALLITTDVTTERAEKDVKEFFEQAKIYLDKTSASSALEPMQLVEQNNSYMYRGEPIVSNRAELPPEVFDYYQDEHLAWVMEKDNHDPIRVIDLDTNTINAVKFGTSGDRGTFDDKDPNKRFSVQRILRVAQGIANYYNSQKFKGEVSIGYDTRALSREYAYLATGVLTANGIHVVLSESAVPVPAVAYDVAISQKVSNNPKAGGIIITASHNPYEYSGIKWVVANGGAAPAGVTNLIQKDARAAIQAKIMPIAAAVEKGLVKLDNTLWHRYTGYVLSQVPEEAREKIGKWGRNPDNSVIVNPMQGSAINYLNAIAGELGIENIREVNNNIDRMFGKVNNVPNPDYALGFDLDVFAASTSGKQVVELFQDADADRFAVRDVTGEKFTANELIPLFAAFLREKGHRGAIAKTLVTSDFANVVDRAAGETTLETDTGFKNLVDPLESGKYLVVGEESAHVGISLFKESKDDGIAVGLMALWIIAEKGSITAYQKEIESKIGKHTRYKRIDTEYKGSLAEAGIQMVELMNLPEANRIVQSHNNQFEFKYSGNEEVFANLKIINEKIQGVAAENGGIAKVFICYDEAAKKSSGYKIVFGNEKWLAIRVSGTGEPTIRLYVEVNSNCNANNWENVREQSIDDLNMFARSAREAIGIAEVVKSKGTAVFSLTDADERRTSVNIKTIDGEVSAKTQPEDVVSLEDFRGRTLKDLHEKYGEKTDLTFVKTVGIDVYYDIVSASSAILSDDEEVPLLVKADAEATTPQSGSPIQSTINTLRTNLIDGLRKQDYPNSNLLETLEIWVKSITFPFKEQMPSFSEEDTTTILETFIFAANSMEERDMAGDPNHYIEKADEFITTYLNNLKFNGWLNIQKKVLIKNAALVPFKYIRADMTLLPEEWTIQKMVQVSNAISGVVRTALDIADGVTTPKSAPPAVGNSASGKILDILREANSKIINTKTRINFGRTIYYRTADVEQILSKAKEQLPTHNDKELFMSFIKVVPAQPFTNYEFGTLCTVNTDWEEARRQLLEESSLASSPVRAQAATGQNTVTLQLDMAAAQKIILETPVGLSKELGNFNPLSLSSIAEQRKLTKILDDLIAELQVKEGTSIATEKDDVRREQLVSIRSALGQIETTVNTMQEERNDTLRVKRSSQLAYSSFINFLVVSINEVNKALGETGKPSVEALAGQAQSPASSPVGDIPSQLLRLLKNNTDFTQRQSFITELHKIIKNLDKSMNDWQFTLEEKAKTFIAFSEFLNSFKYMHHVIKKAEDGHDESFYNKGIITEFVTALDKAGMNAKHKDGFIKDSFLDNLRLFQELVAQDRAPLLPSITYINKIALIITEAAEAAEVNAMVANIGYKLKNWTEGLLKYLSQAEAKQPGLENQVKSVQEYYGYYLDRELIRAGSKLLYDILQGSQREEGLIGRLTGITQLPGIFLKNLKATQDLIDDLKLKAARLGEYIGAEPAGASSALKKDLADQIVDHISSRADSDYSTSDLLERDFSGISRRDRKNIAMILKGSTRTNLPYDREVRGSLRRYLNKSSSSLLASTNDQRPTTNDQKGASSAVNKDSSSPVGGIDFKHKALASATTYEAMGSFVGLDFSLPKLSSQALLSFNLDKEQSDISQAIDNGILVSGQRIKEFMAASNSKGELEQRRETVITWLAKLGILEETTCCTQESSLEYREALVIADSAVI